MPHTYKKKGNREILPQNIVDEAIEEIKGRKGIRPTARKYGIPKSTLLRLSKNNRFKKHNYSSKHSSNQIFSTEEEKMLADYFIHASKLHYGLNRKAALKLAFSFAKSNNIKYPKAWDKGECATKDWIRGFYSRNTNISLRKPEATSLGRSTSFNKNNVEQFYRILKSIMEEKNIRPEDMWNIDETGLTTVHKPKKVLTQKGSKQVGQMTSGERGTLVTVCCSINAIGQTIPPFYIFPRVNFREFMIRGGPTGCKGSAHPSGWMTSENFLTFFKHFLEYAKPSKERPVLIIFDNHDSHIQIDLINMARDNNVIMLTLPPHCSHKLQPLDVSVYAPFKTYFNAAAGSLMLRQPGKPIQIYDIPQLSKEAFEKACTPSNIISGFRRTGIYPFNENTFGEDDFLGAYVTDRDPPELQTKPSSLSALPENTESITDLPEILDARPSSSTVSEETMAPDQPEPQAEPTSSRSTTKESIITPERILPFPKAAPRIKKIGGRKPGKCRVLTQTPEKIEIEEQQSRKKRKNEVKKKKGTIRKLVKFNQEKESSSSEENIDEKDICKDSSSGSEFISDDEDDGFVKLNTDDKTYDEGDYLLVKLQVEGKKESFVHYIGKILQLKKSCIRITYLRKSSKANEFYFPSEEDIDEISLERIIGKLNQPEHKGTSRRLTKYMHFKENLELFENLR